MLLRMLIENKSENPEFAVEHGMSLLIEFQGRRLLLDTGLSGAFADNAFKMGVDIRTVDAVVLSHAHSDHGGGLPRFFRINEQAPVYMSDKAQRKYFSRELAKKEDISVPEAIFEEHPDRIRPVKGFTKLGEDVFIFTDFSRKYPLSRSNRHLLVKSGDGYVRDSFDHELALVLNNGGKLVIVTGCSHNGADNMVESVMGHFPGVPVQSVIGGFHLIGFPFHKLMGESRENIRALGQRLLGYGVERTYTCHCSGDWGYSVLKETMGDRVEYFYAGMQVEL